MEEMFFVTHNKGKIAAAERQYINQIVITKIIL